ncbi:MAG TPA: tRNA pseudouridine(38-40) synthase TruA [Mycobacteriales bacterium]|nr:tRNA pseudouridine(38-40) synthase TruA [Mycobacteriales bacterium]
MRLDVAYDGAPFSGWAVQPGRQTVQGVLEEALGRVLGASVQLTVAGRTDAGVHATGQVCHFDAPLQVDLGRTEPTARTELTRSVQDPPGEEVRLAGGLDELTRRTNGLLDGSVRVLGASAVPDAFDARFGALTRRYEYRVADEAYGVLPLRRHDTLVHPRPLSLVRLRAASRPLVGLHDFAAFCRQRAGATTLRTLRRLSWRRDPDRTLVATLEADAFCHQMVRSLIGTLLPVGDGRRDVEWPAQALASQDRAAAGAVAPAHGLTLVEVRYPPVSRLAARDRTTRRRRS